MTPHPATLEVYAVQGIGEVAAGDDLAELMVTRLDRPLRAGDVVVVTSKVISKAGGLVAAGPRTELLAGETARVVARRGPMQIVRTRHGLTMAAAGIDESNAPTGTAVPLPPDPDGEARTLRARITQMTGVDVAVVVSDTAGRPWRTGQTDIAVGAAGIVPVVSMAGEQDSFGNALEVTAPAVADEVAAAADLVKSKLTGCPIAVVSGLPAAWLSEEDGPGAADIVRPDSADLFGLGAVDAVRAAVGRDRPVRGFPAAEAGALQALVRESTAGVDDTAVAVVVREGPRIEVRAVGQPVQETWVATGVVLERLRVLAAALAVDVPITLGDGSERGEA